MQYMKFEPEGHNLWAVQRRRPESETVKIAEVALNADGTATFIPVESFAFSLDEVRAIVAFMAEAPTQPTAFVLTHTGKAFTL